MFWAVFPVLPSDPEQALPSMGVHHRLLGSTHLIANLDCQYPILFRHSETDPHCRNQTIGVIQE